MFRTAVALVAILTLLVPATSAHSLVEASELETFFVKDELSDTVTATPGMGYDLGEFYLGEAYMTGIGDGFYVHTTLFSAKDAPMQGPIDIAFTFTIDGKAITRTLTTTDRATFKSDFTSLDITATPAEAQVTRAFVSFASAGIGPGAKITALKVECHVGGQLRDIAPGGYHLPEPTGMAPEAQDPNGKSTQLVPTYPLVGPIRYASVSLRATGPHTVEVTVTSLLKKGSQHVHVESVEGGRGTFKVDVQGNMGEIKANASRIFVLTFTPQPDQAGHVSDVHLNATTDIGGRIGIMAMDHAGGIMVAAEPGPSVMVNDAPAKKSGSPAAAILVLILLGFSVLGRKMTLAAQGT